MVWKKIHGRQRRKSWKKRSFNEEYRIDSKRLIQITPDAWLTHQETYPGNVVDNEKVTVFVFIIEEEEKAKIKYQKSEVKESGCGFVDFVNELRQSLAQPEQYAAGIRRIASTKQLLVRIRKIFNAQIIFDWTCEREGIKGDLDLIWVMGSPYPRVAYEAAKLWKAPAKVLVTGGIGRETSSIRYLQSKGMITPETLAVLHRILDDLQTFRNTHGDKAFWTELDRLFNIKNGRDHEKLANPDRDSEQKTWQQFCSKENPIHESVFNEEDLKTQTIEELVIGRLLDKNTRYSAVIPEGIIYYAAMIASGVNAKDILVDAQSTTSVENIIFGAEVLVKNGLHVNNILLIQLPYIQRRAKATLIKQLPRYYPEWNWNNPGQGVVSYAPYLYEGEEAISLLDDEELDHMVELAKGEVRRFREYPYPPKDAIVEVLIPAEVIIAAQALQALENEVSEDTTRPLPGQPMVSAEVVAVELAKHDLTSFTVLKETDEAVVLAVKVMNAMGESDKAEHLLMMVRAGRVRAGPIAGLLATTAVINQEENIVLSNNYPSFNTAEEQALSLVHEIGATAKFNLSHQQNADRERLASHEIRLLKRSLDRFTQEGYDPYRNMKKFYPDGRVRSFQGLTVIAFIRPDSDLFARLVDLQSKIRTALTEAGLSDVFAFLAPETFHMTICDIDPSQKYGPQEIRQAQLEERLGQVREAFQTIGTPGPIKGHVRGLGMLSALTSIVRFDSKELSKVFAIERIIKEAANVSVRNFNGHISLGYMVKYPGDAGFKKLIEIFKEFDTEDLGAFNIQDISFTYFPHMNAYVPLFSKDLTEGNFVEHSQNIEALDNRKEAGKDYGILLEAFNGNAGKLHEAILGWQNEYGTILGQEKTFEQMTTFKDDEHPQGVEYFRLINDLGEYTGAVRPRDLSHVDGSLHRGVAVILFDQKGQILVQVRSAKKKFFPGMRDVSASGHLGLEKEYINAAIQETQEEVFDNKVQLDRQRLIFVTKFASHHVLANAGLNDNEIDALFMYFVTEAEKSSINLQVSEVESVEWVRVEQELRDWLLWHNAIRAGEDNSRPIDIGGRRIGYALLGINIFAQNDILSKVLQVIAEHVPAESPFRRANVNLLDSNERKTFPVQVPAVDGFKPLTLCADIKYNNGQANVTFDDNAQPLTEEQRESLRRAVEAVAVGQIKASKTHWFEIHGRAGYIAHTPDSQHTSLSIRAFEEDLETILTDEFDHALNPHDTAQTVHGRLMGRIRENPARLAALTAMIAKTGYIPDRWLAAELQGKFVVTTLSVTTLSMEGNIPEFEGFDAQKANTKGGLGAYFGDKLEGLADIGIQAYGFQPAYALVNKKDAFVSC